MRIGDNGGEMRIDHPNQMSLEEEAKRVAHDYIGLVIAVPNTRYSIKQLFDEVTEVIKSDTRLAEVLTDPAFLRAANDFIDGPMEELHLAGLNKANLFYWRQACKLTNMTRRERPKQAAFQNRILPIEKFILDRKIIRASFLDAYRPWIQKNFPQKAGEILAIRL